MRLKPPGSVLGPVPRVGGYEILDDLGEGGMGVVYKARQLSVDRIVALKILPPRLAEDERYVARFLREARSAAKLNHSNIVQVFDAGESDGCYYLAMEFVDGQSGDKLLEAGGVLPERRVFEIVRDIAHALDYADTKAHLIHRDIKPANILLTCDGSAKLADLGLARETTETDARLTATGTAMGTPDYISPEQIRGDRDLDIRTDVYSLGATMYHLLTGSPPYTGSTASEVIAKHLLDSVPDPRVANPGISTSSAEIVRKAMAKDRNERYTNASAMLTDVERVLAQGAIPPTGIETIALPPPPQSGVSSGATTVASRSGRRMRMYTTAGAAAALLMVLIVVLLSGHGPGQSGSANPKVEGAIVPADAAKEKSDNAGRPVATAKPTRFDSTYKLSISVMPTEPLIPPVCLERMMPYPPWNSEATLGTTPTKDGEGIRIPLGEALLVTVGRLRNPLDVQLSRPPPAPDPVTTFTDEDFRRLMEDLGKYPMIRGLRFSGCALPEKGIRYLGQLRGLKALCLENTNISDSGIGDLSELADLESLTLDNVGAPPGPAGFVYLKTLKGLKHLYLGVMTDTWQMQVGELTNLETLALIRHFGRQSSLGQLTKLKKLIVTELWGESTERTLAGLSRLKDLEELTLFDCEIVDDNLVHLKGLTNLRSLFFSTQSIKSNITDAGISQFKGLKSLKCLTLSFGGQPSHITKRGIEQLQEAIPGLEVRCTPEPTAEPP